MTMAAANDDTDLLRRYAEERAEDAFAELVRRYIDLVHSAALRQVGGNAATAADVTQSVFVELAHNAGRLAGHPALTGWLYTTTRRMAAHAVRSEARRERREQEAHAMQELLREPVGPDLDWTRLRPVLDAAMHDLGEADRLAVLLRHFEQRPFAEVGAKLGLSENAARMRVSRALDKLRAKLAKRGVTSTASALATALAGRAIAAAPDALAAKLTIAALSATATTTSTSGLLTLMASTQSKITAGAAGLVILATAFSVQHLRAARLIEEKAALERRLDGIADELASTRLVSKQRSEELAKLRTVQPELLRLRGEVARLHREVGTNVAKAPAPGTVDATPETRPTKLSMQVTVPAGSSVLTGGYAPEPGKRTLLVVTPEADVTDPSRPKVEVRSQMFVGSEALMTRLGFASYFTGDGDATSRTTMTAEETLALRKKFEATEGLVMVGDPSLETLSGRSGRFVLGTDGHSERLMFEIVPTVTDQGAVDLSMVIGLAPGTGSAADAESASSPQAVPDGEKP